jgi:hypothetical protein
MFLTAVMFSPSPVFSAAGATAGNAAVASTAARLMARRGTVVKGDSS